MTGNRDLTTPQGEPRRPAGRPRRFETVPSPLPTNLPAIAVGRRSARGAHRGWKSRRGEAEACERRARRSAATAAFARELGASAPMVSIEPDRTRRLLRPDGAGLAGGAE